MATTELVAAPGHVPNNIAGAVSVCVITGFERLSVCRPSLFDTLLSAFLSLTLSGVNVLLVLILLLCLVTLLCFGDTPGDCCGVEVGDCRLGGTGGAGISGTLAH